MVERMRLAGRGDFDQALWLCPGFATALIVTHPHLGVIGTRICRHLDLDRDGGPLRRIERRDGPFEQVDPVVGADQDSEARRHIFIARLAKESPSREERNVTAAGQARNSTMVHRLRKWYGLVL